MPKQILARRAALQSRTSPALRVARSSWLPTGLPQPSATTLEDLDRQIDMAKRLGHSIERFGAGSPPASAEAPIQRMPKKTGSKTKKTGKVGKSKTPKKKKPSKPKPEKEVLDLLPSGGRGGRGKPSKTDRLYEELSALAEESRNDEDRREELEEIYKGKLKKDKSLSRDEQDQIMANRHRFTKDVRVSAKKHEGQVRGTGQDELHETSQTPELFAADAGIIPGKKISVAEDDNQELTHLDLHHYNRSSTGHIFFPTGGAHTPGLKTHGKINSKGNAELDKARTEAAEESGHTSTMLHRVVKAHLDQTARPEDFTGGKFVGEDVWGNDLQDPEVQKMHAQETKKKRTRMKVGAKRFYEKFKGESDSELSEFSDYDEEDLSSGDEVLKDNFAENPQNLIHLHRYDAHPVKKSSKKGTKKKTTKGNPKKKRKTQ